MENEELFLEEHPWLTVESDLDEEVRFALDELRID